MDESGSDEDSDLNEEQESSPENEGEAQDEASDSDTSDPAEEEAAAKEPAKSKKSKKTADKKSKSKSPPKKPKNGKLTGTVKWFSASKGFGFIECNDERYGDVFVHQSSVHAEGFRSLAEGESVEFEVEKNPKNGKDAAVNVTGPDGAFVKGDGGPRYEDPHDDRRRGGGRGGGRGRRRDY